MKVELSDVSFEDEDEEELECELVSEPKSKPEPRLQNFKSDDKSPDAAPPAANVQKRPTAKDRPMPALALHVVDAGPPDEVLLQLHFYFQLFEMRLLIGFEFHLTYF